MRAFAGRALTSRGYKVYEAASGIEALEVMKESGGEIDLVVSDVVMPELDGPSMLRELRKTRPDLKIIFISGYAEDAFRKNLPEGEKFQLPAEAVLAQAARRRGEGDAGEVGRPVLRPAPHCRRDICRQRP